MALAKRRSGVDRRIEEKAGKPPQMDWGGPSEVAKEDLKGLKGL